ncbi:MAG: ATP-dependent Clp protease proteolytic subunit [Bacteroidales bacterium]|nr:ATP-dependent Clp protease proteolytic subunit [Bacteroidales bacterium]
MDLNNEFNLFAVKGQNLNSLTLDRYKKYQDKISMYAPLRSAYINPTIIEERQLNVAQMDVFSRLMMDRIIFLGTAIDDDVANIIQAQLLFLESNDATSDIQIYLNSPGGYVQAGLGIYDTMQYIRPDVATICTGLAASMASVLLCAGAKKKRSALKHSRVMIHQPMGGTQGQASDMVIAVQEIQKTKHELYSIIAEHSGQPIEKIESDADRDHWMTSDEALAYGMIDEVLIREKNNEQTAEEQAEKN